MAKKKKNKNPKPQTLIVKETPEKEIPTFEIGKKGDEFDQMYTRAVREKTADADKLLRELSRESKADKFNFLDAVLPLLLIVFAALTFGVVARGDIEEMFTVSFNSGSMLDGSYTAQLDKIYSDTLPFGEEIAYIGSFFGFGEQEKPLPEVEEPAVIPPEEEEPIVSEPVVTEPVVTEPPETEPTTESTTEPTVVEPTAYIMEVNANVNIRAEASADSDRLGHFEKGELVEVIEIGNNGWAKIVYGDGIAYVFAEYLSPVEGEEPPAVTEEASEYETFVMYAASTVNIRLEASTESAILGYFVVNEPVDVIEIGEDGWAKILYNGMTAYVYSEYLSEEPIVTVSEEEDEPDETVASEDEEEIVPEEDGEVTDAADGEEMTDSEDITDESEEPSGEEEAE